ncbi:MAG: hypothetical protein ABSG68_21145 [Thermoguttaceae bacterium]|jgi:hypothetical protein
MEKFLDEISLGERHNLTIRTLMKRFPRISPGFSKKLENLEAACAMFFCFYNFVRRTRKRTVPGSRRRWPLECRKV